jgi:hypothetical protein
VPRQEDVVHAPSAKDRIVKADGHAGTQQSLQMCRLGT